MPTVEPPSGPIARVDFLNYRYPWPAEALSYEPIRQSIDLTDGSLPETPGADMYAPPGEHGAELRSLTYGDVTGDGQAEALVVINLPVCCKGWGLNCTFVFSANTSSASVLMSFVDGDRAHGGLRDIYAEAGELVIELWGSNSRLSKGAVQIDTNDVSPACCAAYYTRGRYTWNGKRFILASAPVLPNPDPRGLNDGRHHFVLPSTSPISKR